MVEPALVLAQAEREVADMRAIREAIYRAGFCAAAQALTPQVATAERLIREGRAFYIKRGGRA